MMRISEHNFGSTKTYRQPYAPPVPLGKAPNHYKFSVPDRKI